jgi:hypothetical protein
MTKAKKRGRATVRARKLAHEQDYVRTWDEFMRLALSGQFEGWAFRGQQEADWPLSTSLARHLRDYVTDRSAWRAQELRSIRIFRRKAHQFAQDSVALDNMFDCVGHMQQYGAPTRLLDFSKSPFVAAFFALAETRGPSAIWAVDTLRLSTVERENDVGRALDALDPRDGDNFASVFIESTAPFVWTGEPHRMNRRLMFQAGTFVVPSVLDVTLDELLAMHGERLAHKIVLSPELRTAGMATLYRMNITHATLSPDLDGLARSLAYELETNWRKDPS